MQHVHKTACLRKHARLLAAAPSASALVDTVAALGLAFDAWSFTYEQLFPTASHDTLPFLSSAALPALAIHLSRVLAGRCSPAPHSVPSPGGDHIHRKPVALSITRVIARILQVLSDRFTVPSGSNVYL